MRVVAVIMLLFAANLSAGSKLRRIDPTQVSKYQEYVEVKDYRSLDIDIGTPVELISKYQPLKQHQISDEYYRSLMYHPADYSRSGNARPYRSGKLVELTVPPR